MFQIKKERVTTWIFTPEKTSFHCSTLCLPVTTYVVDLRNKHARTTRTDYGVI